MRKTRKVVISQVGNFLFLGSSQSNHSLRSGITHLRSRHGSSLQHARGSWPVTDAIHLILPTRFPMRLATFQLSFMIQFRHAKWKYMKVSFKKRIGSSAIRPQRFNVIGFSPEIPLLVPASFSSWAHQNVVKVTVLLLSLCCRRGVVTW